MTTEAYLFEGLTNTHVADVDIEGDLEIGRILDYSEEIIWSTQCVGTGQAAVYFEYS